MNPITRLKQYIHHCQAERQIKKQANDLYETAKVNATEYRRIIPCLPFRRAVGFNQGRMVQSLLNVIYVTGVPDEVKALLTARFGKEQGGPNMKAIRVEYVDVYNQLLGHKAALSAMQKYKQELQQQLDRQHTFATGDEANNFHGLLTRAKASCVELEKGVIQGLNRLTELRFAMRNCVANEGSAQTDIFLRYAPTAPEQQSTLASEHEAIWNTCSERLNIPQLPRVARPIFSS